DILHAKFCMKKKYIRKKLYIYITINMYDALIIPELLEIIFAFLSRKDLYRSCARVNSQWNAISRRVIQKKRKSEFINIPNIHDNILFHLFNSCGNFIKLKEY